MRSAALSPIPGYASAEVIVRGDVRAGLRPEPLSPRATQSCELENKPHLGEPGGRSRRHRRGENLSEDGYLGREPCRGRVRSGCDGANLRVADHDLTESCQPAIREEVDGNELRDNVVTEGPRKLCLTLHEPPLDSVAIGVAPDELNQLFKELLFHDGCIH